MEGTVVADIGRGLLVLVGVRSGDTDAAARYVADKVARLRIFEDEDGKMNLDVRDAGGEVLVVSQFTLYADVRRGRRPSFVDAAERGVAEPLLASVCECLRAHGLAVAEGRFGARMEVELVNAGPVTILIEST